MKNYTRNNPSECKQCIKLTDKFLTHKRPHSKDPVNNKQCGKAFSSHLSFQTHNTNHTGRKPHECKKCSKAFRCPSYLWIHEKKKHVGENYEYNIVVKPSFFTQPFEDS